MPTHITPEARFLSSVESNLDGIGPISIGPASSCEDCRSSLGAPCPTAIALRKAETWEGLTLSGLESALEYSEDAFEEAFQVWEEEFSNSSCDSCGSYLAGGRYTAHGSDDETGQPYCLSVCVDCVLFHANGDTPENWG